MGHPWGPCGASKGPLEGLLAVSGAPLGRRVRNLNSSIVATSASSEVVCSDTSGGATGLHGYTCDVWTESPSWCDGAYYYDDTDFTATDLCCACGGGSMAPTLAPPPTPCSLASRGALGALLGPSLRPWGPSWGHLGGHRSKEGGAHWRPPVGAFRIVSWAALGRSWAHLGPLLGPSWGSLGPLLGPSWAILEPS